MRAFRFDWLPIAGDGESDPYDPDFTNTRLIGHDRIVRSLLGILAIGNYLEDEECHGVVRAAANWPIVDDFIMVTVRFLTPGIVVDTLQYPTEGGASRAHPEEFRPVIRKPDGTGAAESLRVTRTVYGPRVYNLLSGELGRNDIATLSGVKRRTYGPRPKPKKRTIPIPERKRKVGYLFSSARRMDIPGTWHVEIAALENDGTMWSHDFWAQPFGLADARYTRILLALARVSPPLADRMRLPGEWTADDPEPLRRETFPALELPNRPFHWPEDWH